MKQKKKVIKLARFCDTGLHGVNSLPMKIAFITNAYHGEFIINIIIIYWQSKIIPSIS